MKTNDQTDVQDAQSLNRDTERIKRSSAPSNNSGSSSPPTGGGVDAPQQQTSSEETSKSTIQQQKSWVDPRVQQFKANMQGSSKMQHLAQLQAQADAYTQAQQPTYVNNPPAQLQDGATGAEELENIISKQAFTLTLVEGKTLQVEAGIMATVYSYNDEGNPREISVEINGIVHRGTIDAVTAKTCFPPEDTVTTIAYTDKKLQQVRDMVAQDEWYTNFGEEQAVSLLRGLNSGEIRELLGDDQLMASLRHYFSRENWAHSVEPWNMDLGQKFDLIAADNSGGLLDYNNDLRTMIFNSPHSKPLKAYEVRIQGLTGTAVSFKDKLSPEEQAAYDKEHLYDDQKNKGNHKADIETDDTDAMIRVNEGKANDKDKESVLKFFQKNALAEAFSLLELSEKELQKVLEGYTDEELNDIGTAFMKFMAQPSSVMKGKSNLEAYQHFSVQSDHLTPMGNALVLSTPQGKMGAVVGAKQQADKRQNAIRIQLGQQLGKQFPMLCDMKLNLSTLHEQFKSKKYETIRTDLEKRTTDYLSNIRTTRENLREDPEMVFKLDPIVKNTFTTLGLKKDSASGKIVQEHIDGIKRVDTAISIGLAALSIGLGLLSVFTGGTTALVAASLGAGVGAADAHREYQQYSVKHAAANTSMSQAQALTKDDPSFLWVAIAAIGALGDIASAAKVLRAVKASKVFVEPLQNASDLGRYTDEVTAAIAKEKGVKAGSDEYKAIQQIVREKAQQQLATKVAKAEDRTARKAYYTEKYNEALQDFNKSLMGRVYTGIPVDAMAKLGKLAVYALRKEVPDSLEDFIARALGMLKKKKIEVDEAEVKEVLERIYKKEQAALRQQEMDREMATTAMNYARMAHQMGILDETLRPTLKQIADGYMETSGDVMITYTFKKQTHTKPITFNSDGKMLAGGTPVSRAERDVILREMDMTHAIDQSRHGMNATETEVAERIINNSTISQVGKFTNDEHLLKLRRFVLETHGQGGAASLRTGADEVAPNGNFIFKIPIPANYGRVFTSLDPATKGATVVNPQPFTRSDLSHIKEVEARQAILVFAPDGSFKTGYTQAFNE